MSKKVGEKSRLHAAIVYGAAKDSLLFGEKRVICCVRMGEIEKRSDMVERFFSNIVMFSRIHIKSQRILTF